MFLNHITIPSGNNRRSPRSEVSADTIAMLKQWLMAGFDASKPFPLPGELGQKYSAKMTVENGAFLCTVYSGDAPLVTFGVAERSRHSSKLWELLTQFDDSVYKTKPSLEAPSVPWCGVVMHGSLMTDPDAQEWLGNFECCVAWAWLSAKNPKWN